MVEVGIPVYKARETLPDALNSLVAQTRKNFITCLSIDGEADTYQDIIDTYKARGLKIRVIRAKENGGPGAARQRIIDTTQCNYLIFLDADDMLMPQAVSKLYDTARYGNFDILRAGFIREEKHKEDVIMPGDMGTITWTHGKIYKVAYLRDNNIHFLDGLRVDEDANFNLIAWNCSENRGQIKDLLYLWRDNKNSITRHDKKSNYFKDTFNGYIYGQVEGLKTIYNITQTINNSLITQTLINIYEYYMKAKFYKQDLTAADNSLSTLKNEPWMQYYLQEGQNWINLVNNLKSGTVIEKEYVVFYQETINVWISRLLRKENVNGG